MKYLDMLEGKFLDGSQESLDQAIRGANLFYGVLIVVGIIGIVVIAWTGYMSEISKQIESEIKIERTTSIVESLFAVEVDGVERNGW